MTKLKISSHDQSGGTTANRVNSPSISVSKKIITRQRTEGFIAGTVLAIVTGIIGNFLYDWLFK